MPKQSEGKRLGKLVLYVFLILICNIVIILSYEFKYKDKSNIETWLTILRYLLTALGIVWGAKASSNFAKRIRKEESFNDGN